MFIQRGFNTQSVVFNIVLINVLAFIASLLSGTVPVTICGYQTDVLSTKLNLIGGLYLPTSELFKPWQIIMHFFLHANLMHLFFNMFALFMFAPALEHIWGPKKFFGFYIWCAMGAAFLFTAVKYWEIRDAEPIIVCISENMPAIGASGAVFGVLTGFGMLFPNTELLVFPIPFPIKAKYLVIGYGLLELTMGFQNQPKDSVAHFAHIGGMLFGFILIKIWQRRSGNFY